MFEIIHEDGFKKFETGWGEIAIEFVDSEYYDIGFASTEDDTSFAEVGFRIELIPDMSDQEAQIVITVQETLNSLEVGLTYLVVQKRIRDDLRSKGFTVESNELDEILAKEG